MIRYPVPSTGLYILVWIGLLLLLLLTWGSAYLPMGPFNVVLNIAIAIAKMLLVMLFFMHLRSASPILRLFAGIGFIFWLILIGLSLADFATRTVMVKAG